jgi:signal transduction histidine kinase
MAQPDRSSAPATANRRILIVDDSRAIHADFRKILAPVSAEAARLAEIEHRLFGDPRRTAAGEPAYELDSAHQGEEALVMVGDAAAAERPYAMAFVDVRMPPGWDGIETALRLWEVDPLLELVICTAYSDYSWEETAERLGSSERFLILKKPFDHVEVRQLAAALTRKWDLARQLEARARDMEKKIQSRTAAIRTAHDRLQRQTAERHLMEAQLRRAQKLEALGRLAAGVAHEINNPLAFVITNMQFVREALAKPAALSEPAALEELRDALAESCAGGDRIKQIVRDLKAFAQPQDDALQPVQLRPLLEFSLKITAVEIRRVAQIVTSFENVPDVWAIPGRLEQVFVNLLINAAQAIPPGRAQDNEVQIRVRGGPDATVVVEVSDTGVGIPAENLERIFDPFFTTKPLGVGTGLGLSICHSIVEAFGGELTVDSAPERGSTFRLALPVVAAAVPEEAAPAHDPGPGAAYLSGPGAAPVLIVDEQPAMTKAIRRMLSAHRVEAVASGIEALACCQESSFDLIIYDLGTSDLGAREMYRRLRKLSPPLARRLVFTGATDAETRAWAAAHDLRCLDNPFDVAAVRSLLRALPPERPAGGSGGDPAA